MCTDLPLNLCIQQGVDCQSAIKSRTTVKLALRAMSMPGMRPWSAFGPTMVQLNCFLRAALPPARQVYCLSSRRQTPLSQRSSKVTSSLLVCGQLEGVLQQPTCVIKVMVGIEDEIDMKAPAGTQLLDSGLGAKRDVVATDQHEKQVSPGGQC